ncbi:putative short-chain oxidoreductase [Mycena albidolilacea]|uniref:Short-chain oxidoreductase n=1 Tax=Mycena albidolilacea TaxID=1033008 RepID=A0AAD7EPY7_9AGAR|nr:putative short-chain oxidoreductase [Mycena albidolilacea]
MSKASSVILITGCSTGFGRELAQAALSAGLRVIATARRPDTLAALREKGAKTMKLDVTASAEELRQFASDAISLFGRVDYLINNAGFLQGGAIEENNPEENLAQFNTNVFGVINVTNAFLPHWRARKQGTIVNVSSQGAMMCIPGAGIYCASKAALDALSDTWARELAGFNIRCVSVQLGSFRTSVAESGNLKIAAANIDGYQGSHDWVAGFNKSAGKERGDPAIAAAKIIELVSVEPEGAPLPMRLVLGEDSYENAKAFYEKQLRDLETWKDVSTGTDVVE